MEDLTPVVPPAHRGAAYLAAPVVAAIALLAIGCRGQSADERYAERVCARTLVPAQEMLDLLDRAQIVRATPGEEGFSQLMGLIQAGQSIARTLDHDLKALPVPNSPAGREASRGVQSLPRGALGTLAAKEQSARALGGPHMTLVENIHALNDLELGLVDAYSSMTDDPLAWMHVRHFQRPFEHADSCKKVTALGTRR